MYVAEIQVIAVRLAYQEEHDDGLKPASNRRQSRQHQLTSTSSFNLTEALHMDFEVGLRPNNQLEYSV